MTWLVTGGAGYVGAHVTHAMVEAGFDVVALDNLTTGRRGWLPSTVPLGWVSVTDQDDVRDVMEENAITGVIHLAAFARAEESVRRPLDAWRVNLGGTLAVLGAMAELGIDRLVHSSTAAVFGGRTPDVIGEDETPHPESPYGSSALAAERAILEQAAATASAKRPMRHTTLRYGNAVGSAVKGVHDTSAVGITERVLGALARGDAPRIHGGDYPTPDGTCVRDPLHVADVAAAHVAAATALDAGTSLRTTYHLGTGRGVSAREIVAACQRATGTSIEPLITDRSPGEPARRVMSGRRARHDLDWEPRHSIDEMAASAHAALPGVDSGAVTPTV